MIYYIHFSLIKLWHLILTAENIHDSHPEAINIPYYK